METMKNKMLGFVVSAQNKIANIKSDVNNKLEEKRRGAFAFEYIIVLVLMVAVIFAAWQILTPVIMQKVQDIADIVTNNGV